MEYRRVEPNRELLEATADHDTVELVFCGRYEICMIAGFDDADEIVCYAVFSHLPGRDRYVYMEYLYTYDDHREHYISGDLLSFCESYLSSLGFSDILCRIYLTPEHAIEYNEFITHKGFVPLNLTGRMLEYRLSGMLESGTIQTIIKARNKLPPLLDLDSVGPRPVNVLLSQKDSTGFFFYKDECDSRYSRFFLVDDRIHAAIIATRPKHDTLYISAIYMDNIGRQYNVALPLFCTCLEPILADVDEEDINVFIEISNETIYNGLMNVFNPPDHEYLILEYMKLISSK